MKTIEERAIEKYPITAENADKAIAMRKIYIQIATEQEAIDNRKLSKRINALFGESGGAIIDGSWWTIDEIEDFLN